MKHCNHLLAMNLHLFDGGAAAGSAGAAAAGNAAAAGTESVSGISRSDNTGGSKTRVIYGKQAVDAPPDAGDGDNGGGNTAKNDPKEREKRYRELVGGEFKEEYTKDTQRIINGRFKETKGLQEAIDAQAPIMQMLYERYGVEDPAQLSKALEADNSLWEQAADEAGMSVEQYRQFKSMERQNAAFRQMQQQAQNQERARQQVSAWMQEAETLKAEYPDFDLEAALDENPQFIKLLQSGIPMKHAYEVLHMDLVKEVVAKKAAENTERRVVDNVRARGSRPSEAGAASQSGVVIKNDPSKLTPADRREIARRARRGDYIEF